MAAYELVIMLKRRGNRALKNFSLAVIADVIALREMPDTRYGSASFKIFGFAVGVVGNLNPAVVLYPVKAFFHTYPL